MNYSEKGVKSRKRKFKPDRLEYLDKLVIEFQDTKSRDAKQQILANLANFAYDPFNYNFFRELNILDLFLDHLADPNQLLRQFAIGGLCNCCLDPKNKEYILKNSGIEKIKNLLKDSNENVVISAITTLMYLVTPESKPEITSTDIIRTVVSLSRSNNNRIKNVSIIFLEDYCTENQIKEVTNADSGSSSSTANLSEIPLPPS